MPAPAKVVLVLAPHPDDAEIYAGGLIARLAREGCRVIIAIATDGCAGSLDLDPQTLVELRRAEAAAGARILGAETPVMLAHPDQGLDLLPPGFLREQFTRLVRLYQPHTVICQDIYTKNEAHPDHLSCARAALEAVRFAHLPLVYPEHAAAGLAPHLVTEKYYYSEPGTPGADHVIDIGDFIDQKIAAFQAHRTQVEFLVEDLVRQAEAAGLDRALFMAAAGGSPASAVDLYLRAQAVEAGQPGGFLFGEAYRRERFHPAVEMLLAGSN